MIRRTTALALVTLLAYLPTVDRAPPSANAAGRTFWVSPGGSDSNSGTQATPFATIQRGVKAARPGDTVLVEDGTYTATSFPMVRFARGGSQDAWVTLAAAPGASPLLRGTGAYRYGIILNPGVSWVEIRGLTLENFAADGIQLGCRACTSKVEHRNIRLADVEVRDGGTAFRPTDGGRITVADSWFHDNTEVGIDCAPGPCNRLTVSGTRLERHTGYDWSDGLAVESGKNIKVVDSIASGNAGDGFDSKANGTVVLRSISVDNSRDGIKLWKGTCEIRDSISAANGLTGVVLETGDFTLANVLVVNGGTAERAYGMTVAYDGGPATTLRMFNTMFSGNNGTALYLGAPVTFVREDHDLFDVGDETAIVYDGMDYSASDITGGGWTTATGLGVGTLATVAQFMAPGDYHLQAASPGVDDGTASGASAKDLDGVARPLGAAFDIGPYER